MQSKLRYILHFLAGSKFWHTGAFEVKKETNADNIANSLIDVNISSDLSGLSEVQVRVTDRGGFEELLVIVILLVRV